MQEMHDEFRGKFGTPNRGLKPASDRQISDALIPANAAPPRVENKVTKKN